MKTNILTLIFTVTFGLVFSQNKVEKCNNLAQEKQKTCKVNSIISLISDYATYPENALVNLDEGTVYIRFTTNEQREISNLRTLGNPNEELAEAAKAAIELFSKSENTALLVNNEVYRIPVRFELH